MKELLLILLLAAAFITFGDVLAAMLELIFDMCSMLHAAMLELIFDNGL